MNNPDVLLFAKRYGFSDKVIAHRWNTTEDKFINFVKNTILSLCLRWLIPVQLNLSRKTPYFYSTYEQENESVIGDKKKIVVLGSGPIRIGQGVEFDYATVHAVKAIKESGYEAIYYK